LPDPGFVGSYLAHSFFDVFFTVDVAEDYRLTGFVFYGVPGLPNAGFSRVLFEDVTNSVVLFGALSDESNPGLTSFNEVIALQTGVTYRLRLQARTGATDVAGGEFGFGTSSWEVFLRPTAFVPEPSTGVLAALGFLTLVPLARRRARTR
jgi:hypothetical protein